MTQLSRIKSRIRRNKSPLQRLLLVTIALVLVLSGGMYWTNGGGVSAAGLTKVGPIHPDNGYPVWYKDSNGTIMQLCLDVNDPYCGMLPTDVPNPNEPISLKTGNFPGESFYMLAGAELELGNGERAIGGFQLEAAFAQGDPIDGDQIVFGRVRIRVDGLVTGETYKVTHPYGVDTFTAVVADTDEPEIGEINSTVDIGVDGGFQGALTSKIGPFLQWDPAVAPAAPLGYVGDPGINHKVIGSVLTDASGNPQNYFKIEGPGVGRDANGTFSPNACGGNNPNCIETDLFSLMGKKATNLGVDITRATYSRTSETGGFIDVFASSEGTTLAMDVSGTGIQTTRMQGGGDGYYFARVAFTGNPPAEITVTNTNDVPQTVKKINLVDQVIVTKAEYNTVNKTLTVTATSSDLATPTTFTIEGFEATLVDGNLVVANMTYLPPNITITSSKNGNITVPVTVTGGVTGQIPIIVSAGPDQNAVTGASITLTGDSSGDPNATYLWTQTAGTTVTLTGANTKTATFNAPNTTGTLEFLLTVTGSDGVTKATDTVQVFVANAAPVANAGPDQSAVAQGSLITLDGSLSTNTTGYSWKQTAGPTVTLNLANPAKPTFTFPKQPNPITFELTASGSGASSTDTVTISTVPDKPTITRAEYRRTNRSWRVDGTTDVFGPGVTISIHLGNTISGPVIGTTQVTTTGAWSFTGTSPAGTTTPRTISVKSSSGGKVENFTVRVR